MSSILLDTSVLIAAERSVWDLDDLLADEDEPAVAAITLAELGVGVDMATGRRRARRAAFLEDLAATIPVLAYDTDVAHAHRALLVAVRAAGKPRGRHDLIIAATAASSGRTVVTADLKGFGDLPGVAVRGPSPR